MKFATNRKAAPPICRIFGPLSHHSGQKTGAFRCFVQRYLICPHNRHRQGNLKLGHAGQTRDGLRTRTLLKKLPNREAFFVGRSQRAPISTPTIFQQSNPGDASDRSRPISAWLSHPSPCPCAARLVWSALK